MGKKIIGSVTMTLVTKENAIKIGKLNDQINTDRTIITKDPVGKNYKLIEKKSKNEEARLTGSLMAEQSSKYLVLQYNSETGKVEVSPGGDWYFFKKEINYPTMSIEEVEEKMKGKTGLLEYIRNRGVLTKPKKEKKVKIREGAVSDTRIPFGRLNDEDEDMEDEVRAQLVDRVEEQSEEDRAEDMDPELQEVPSDIEEGFIKGKSTKDDDTKTKPEAQEESSLLDDDDDNLFGADEDDEGVDNEDEDFDESQGFSEIDKEEDLTENQENYITVNPIRKNFSNVLINANTKDQDFVRTKRKSESLNNLTNSDRKKQRTSSPIEEILESMFAKNKSMTYDKIVRELLKSNFSKTETDSYLPNWLNKMCQKYSQGGEHFYFKKIDF